MPAAMVDKMVDVLGMSRKEAEDLWDKAKAQASNYKDVEKDSPRYFKIVTGILKNMLGDEKCKKLKWESKAEKLLNLIDGLVSEYTGVSMQAYNNIATRYMAKLEKAIDTKNVNFFSELFKDEIVNMFYDKKTEDEIYNFIRDKVVKSLHKNGLGMTQEKISNIKEIIREMISSIKKGIKDLEEYDK